MTAGEYQKLCRYTLTPECNNLNYLTLGLTSESGEVAGKVKKQIRGDYGSAIDRYTDRFKIDTLLEVGDALWYLTMICDYFGVSLESVMEANIKKLRGRKQNGTIKGDGDDR